MKKLLITGSLLAISANLYALDICGSNFSLNSKFESNKSWVKKSEGVRSITYEKFEGKAICSVEVAASKIINIKKRFKIDAPIKPPLTMDNCKFNFGQIFYIQGGTQKDNIYSTGESFIEEFNKGSSFLKYSKAEYKSDNQIITSITMCKELGRQCSNILEVEAPYTGSDEAIKKIEETQKLKLMKTEGWK
jgi:hypothetical protein